MARKRPASRTKRWLDATVKAREAYDRLDEVMSDLEGAFTDLTDLRSEYEEWLENMSENLKGGATGEKLQAIIDVEFPDDPREKSADELDELVSAAEEMDLPLGFGRD